MRGVSRRTFLAALASALPTASFVQLAHAAAVDDLVGRPQTLLALGEAVLPAELGRARMAASVDGFQRWIAGYREGVELVHGYGTSKLSSTGPTPATRWATQLDALDRSGARMHSRPFASLTIAQRQALIRVELEAFKEDRIPPIGRCPHVALALLAHFYGSDAATDLCYDAQILRENCRPLAMSSRKPLPLARSSRT
ncbi:hypothetical protein [Gemmatimonas sp.]|uniref:hypothetical protein n=1 Tax=Gemmatimonas sp. TaxID=1962908 RepID=UPI0039839921